MLTAQGQSGHFYSPANAQRCLDALKTASCTAIDDGTFAADCGGVYVEATVAGQLCFDGSWCKAGLVCAFDMPDSEGGTCRVAGALGESYGIVGCGPFPAANSADQAPVSTIFLRPWSIVLQLRRDSSRAFSLPALSCERSTWTCPSFPSTSIVTV
jgi:hypothetical protein